MMKAEDGMKRPGKSASATYESSFQTWRLNQAVLQTT